MGETLLILVGGDETTRHVLSGGLYQLLRHPERWEALVADSFLLDGAMEEMLRWVSPIKNMARTAVRDVELRGKTISAGQKLLLLYPSANRDAEQFDNPLLLTFVAFRMSISRSGNGPHFCLGNALARLEMRVTFNVLVDRLPGKQRSDVAEPAFRPDNFVSGYEGDAGHVRLTVRPIQGQREGHIGVGEPVTLIEQGFVGFLRERGGKGFTMSSVGCRRCRCRRHDDRGSVAGRKGFSSDAFCV